MIWPEELPAELWGDYVVTEEALSINRERINIRMPKKARFTERRRDDL
jgi:deoxyribonuclease (pyrimidine dimer)